MTLHYCWPFVLLCSVVLGCGPQGNTELDSMVQRLKAENAELKSQLTDAKNQLKEEIMTDATEVVENLCERYQTAVSNNDSDAYSKLFAEDAIRIPPGSEPEHGPNEIRQSEQRDYDIAKWTVQSRALDALRIDENWILGIGEGDVTTVAHADGETKSFRVNKIWLLQKQLSGQWLIKRQMWNLK